jgi:hypothetical protein
MYFTKIIALCILRVRLVGESIRMERFHSSFFRMEPFYSPFGKQNRATLFFVWLKSKIERSRSIFCLVGEPYECRGKRKESIRVRESAHIRPFWWSGSTPIIYDKFLYGDSRSRSATLLLETKHPKNLNGAAPFSSTLQPNTQFLIDFDGAANILCIR